MRLVSADEAPMFRPATVNKNFSLSGEYVRKATWQDGDTLVTVEVIGYVSGVRARKKPDGSEDLVGIVSHFDVMAEHEHVRPVERAVFIWRRRRPGPSGDWIEEEEVDYSNEIGVFYKDTVEDAMANVQLWLADLDFEAQFDPEAWEVPVGG